MMSKEKLFRLAERTLKRTEAYQDNRELDVPDSENYKIDYLLVKGGKSASEDVIAYASYEDEMLRFRPLEEKDKPFWDSSAKFDTEIDLFQYLEEGYSLAGMYGWILRNITVNINRRTVCRNISITANATALPKTGWQKKPTMTAWT